MIQHTVAFRLNPGADAASFIAEARALADIPGVTDFEVLRQVGEKTDLTHALSMRFESDEAYSGYNDHPEHVAFVNAVWVPNVADFIELDYVLLDS